MIIFHHIGLVVSNLEKYESNLLYESKINVVFDEIQQAKLALYKNFSESYIELIEPQNESSYTWKSLVKNGNHINHFCYSADSLHEVEGIAEKLGFLYLRGPIPARLFNNSNVIFYFNRNRQVVEFLIK